jgi:hypothetical protein
MKLGTGDFSRLQFALLAALAMIGGAGGAAYLALDAARHAHSELAAAQKARDEIDARWKRVRSEETEIRQNLALYGALQARGVVGDERRLEWTELLKDVSARRRLSGLRYEFSPQRALDATSAGASAARAAAPPDQDAYVSTLTLEVDLLHEDDLIHLLDDLRAQASALVQVKRCSVARLPQTSDGPRRANLHAACQLDWITLRAPSPGKQP